MNQMSQDITFICPKEFSFARFKESIICIPDTIELEIFESDDEIQFQEDFAKWYTSMLLIDLREETIEWYETDDLLDSEFRKKVHNYIFYVVSFNNIDILKKYLLKILKDNEKKLHDIWIDNDYGKVINGRVFLRKLQEDLNWDWRQENLDIPMVF